MRLIVLAFMAMLCSGEMLAAVTAWMGMRPDGTLLVRIEGDAATVDRIVR